MKFSYLFLCGALSALTLSSAQAENIMVDWDALNLSENAAESASDLIAADADAILAMRDTEDTLTEEEREVLRRDYELVLDCGSFGYNFVDLDSNGTPELIIATNCPEDEFFGKMLLEVYTLGEEDAFTPVLKSAERDRYYYCGGNRIANVGSSGAYDSVDTTYAFENGQLIDQKVSTDPAAYVQMDLEVLNFEVDNSIVPDYVIDMSEELTDCMLQIGLKLPEDADETSLYAMIYNEDLFDDVEKIANIQPGCVLYTGGDEIAISSVEEKDGNIVINGGSENGGLELVNEEDTNGFFAERGGKHLFTLMGQAQLLLADTVSVNGKTVARADVGTELAALGSEFGPEQLTVRLENGFVMEIEAKNSI